MALEHIPMDPFSPEFLAAWQSAGQHINRMSRLAGLKAHQFGWLKATPTPPHLEHFSFRVVNQLIFVRIIDVDEIVVGPGSLGGLFHAANMANAWPCLMPMKEIEGDWRPAKRGWGLIDPGTGQMIDPPALVTNEEIAMSDWEIHDFAIQIVRSDLEKEGRELMSWQSNPEVDPSLWFVGDSGPEWVIVRARRSLTPLAAVPEILPEIVRHCARFGRNGNLAVVGVTGYDQTAKTGGHPAVRGRPLWTEYKGLKRV